MSSLANWYSNHYGVWRRTRHTSTAPYVATAANVVPQPPATLNAVTEKTINGAPDTLFGPSLGAVAQAPEWTNRLAQAGRDKPAQDELTPDIVRQWVQKSKDKTQPTTTLQALVNLKRPTLRLSPLTDAEGDAPNNHVHAHAVEFEYDADVPKCCITIHVLPANDRAAPVQVYEHVVDGGFGKHLRLEDDATIELTKFELTAESIKAETADPASASTPGIPASTSEAMLSPPSANPAGAASGPAKRRFSNFHFRKPRRVAQSAGPALQVVDVDAQAQHGATDGEGGTEAPKTDDTSSEGGVRVIIKLEALDEHEHPLASVNSQTTYLHVVRLGSKPDRASEDEDSRPWVVKVVKREATIGYHTFHLHEIYGLTAGGNTNAGTEETTYPPSAPAAEASYEFAGQECVLCLSSPREVVLLPCRHLVACRDCALNMIEFGAGGQLNQTTETPAAGGEAGADGAAGTGGATPAPVPTPAPRARKRKPKGWFCPVCRQPYTSLLRISTTPPDAKNLRGSEDSEEVGDIGTVPLAAAGITTVVPPAHVVGDATPSPSPTPGAAPIADEKEDGLPDDAVVIPVMTIADDAPAATTTTTATTADAAKDEKRTDPAQMV